MNVIMQNEAVKAALKFIKDNDEATLQEQLKLCIIPAPSYDEHERALYIKSKFADIGLDNVRIDEAGNVLGEINGTGKGPKLMIAAHLDTVFSIETPLEIKKEGNVYKCPGINDNARGLSELLTVAMAVKSAAIRPVGDIIFCANVCEEGLGDLKGTRHIFNTMNIDAFITLDSSPVGKIVYKALGSLRFRVTYTCCGGHSAGDFGIPNPVHALGRAINKISNFQVPVTPRTTFNIGVIEGGTSVNSIAKTASMLIDMRSESTAELERLSVDLEKAVCTACEEEQKRWNSDKKLEYLIEMVGNRPAGTQPDDCPIVKIAEKAIHAVGCEPELAMGGSTDANIPISLGIPAIAVGRGNKGGGIHTVDEWFEPVDAYKAPQKNLLMALYISGIDGCCEPWTL